MQAVQTPPRHRHFATGERVVVRNAAEIVASLDENGTIDGLPFMPEMAGYCGQEFRVARHVEHVYLDQQHYVARLADTVILEGLRCDGASHGGCQMGCQLLWKTHWLAPANDGGEHPPTYQILPFDLYSRLKTEQGDRIFCQASQLVDATRRMPWWDVRQYVRMLTYGELRWRDLASMLGLLVYNRLRWLLGYEPHGTLSGPCERTTVQVLDLQPGERVEVKSREEIAATLDVHGKNRGLAFVPEMALFCGRQFQVAQRVEKMVVEGTGELRNVKHTVALESVVCCGLAQRRCPRGCFHLWREAWLKRV